MRTAGWIVVVGFMVVAGRDSRAQERDGTALEFDGSLDFVEVADPVNATAALTIEAWIRADAFAYGRVVCNESPSAGYNLDVEPGGGIRFALAGNLIVHAPAVLTAGAWTHVAATWAGPTGHVARIYVDGDEVATGICDHAIAASVYHLRIGCTSGGFYFFDGGIDEVRIFDAEVAPRTLAAWKGRTISADHPDYERLQGAWCFEEGTGQVAASEVESPARDGRLGLTMGADAADPHWSSSGMLPTCRATWGGLKAAF